jgi:hypothetical protein
VATPGATCFAGGKGLGPGIVEAVGVVKRVQHRFTRPIVGRFGQDLSGRHSLNMERHVCVVAEDRDERRQAAHSSLRRNDNDARPSSSVKECTSIGLQHTAQSSM